MVSKFSYLKNHGPVLGVISAVSLFLVLPQILNHSLILGGDSLFHFNRIYDIYMQFKTGNFSYFQSNYGFLQSGRIINALYGPGFAYLLGALLVLVHNWINFQIITSFFAFFISGYTMFFLSREMGSTKKISLLTATLFMGSFWITRWSTNQSFMTWGVMLMPLIVLIGIKMLKNDSESLHVLPFALIFSLLIQVHVLSTLMSIIVLGIFFIFSMIKNKKRNQLLLKCFFAGMLTLLLTFNVWGAMLDVFGSEKLYSPFSELSMSNFTTDISVSTYDTTHIGFVLSLIFLLQIGLYFFKSVKFTTPNKVVTILGTFFLILSSTLIPWTKLSNIIPQLQSSLQFPYRFIGFATVLLLAGFGATITSLSSLRLKKYFEIFMIILSGFILFQSYTDLQNKSALWNTDRPIISKSLNDFKSDYSNEQIKNIFVSSNLEKGLQIVTNESSDYLPKYYSADDASYNQRGTNGYRNKGDSEAYTAYGKYINRNTSAITTQVVNDKLIISWNAIKKTDKIQLPIVIYANSLITLNNHHLNKDKMTLSIIGTPTITSPKAGKNTLILSYHSNLITMKSILVVISAWIISVIALIILTMKKRYKPHL